MYKYVIHQGITDSTVFLLKAPLSHKELQSIFIRSTVSFKPFSFPDKDGQQIISDKVGLVVEDFMRMGFIMRYKKLNAIMEWRFKTRWNHPLLKIEPFKLEGKSWHNASVNKFLEILKKDLIVDRDNEDVLQSFIDLINITHKIKEDFFTEILLAIAVSYVQPAPRSRRTMFIENFMRKLDMPRELTRNKYDQFNLERIPEQISRENIGIKIFLPQLSNLLTAIYNRSDIKIKKLSDIKTTFLFNLNDFDFWLMNKEVNRFTAMLKDENLSVDTIIEKMNFSPNYFNCFIIYSSDDHEFAHKLHDDLASKGVRCWFAPKQMKAGEKIHYQIQKAIEGQDKVILILSQSSMKSEWVKSEISNARSREVKEGSQLLIPIRLISFELIQKWKFFDSDIGKDSAKEIREYFIPDFSNWSNPRAYKENLNGLLLALEKSRN